VLSDALPRCVFLPLALGWDGCLGDGRMSLGPANVSPASDRTSLPPDQPAGLVPVGRVEAVQWLMRADASGRASEGSHPLPCPPDCLLSFFSNQYLNAHMKYLINI